VWREIVMVSLISKIVPVQKPRCGEEEEERRKPMIESFCPLDKIWDHLLM